MSYKKDVHCSELLTEILNITVLIACGIRFQRYLALFLQKQCVITWLVRLTYNVETLRGKRRILTYHCGEDTGQVTESTLVELQCHLEPTIGEYIYITSVHRTNLR